MRLLHRLDDGSLLLRARSSTGEVQQFLKVLFPTLKDCVSLHVARSVFCFDEHRSSTAGIIHDLQYELKYFAFGCVSPIEASYTAVCFALPLDSVFVLPRIASAPLQDIWAELDGPADESTAEPTRFSCFPRATNILSTCSNKHFL